MGNFRPQHSTRIFKSSIFFRPLWTLNNIWRKCDTIELLRNDTFRTTKIVSLGKSNGKLQGSQFRWSSSVEKGGDWRSGEEIKWHKCMFEYPLHRIRNEIWHDLIGLMTRSSRKCCWNHKKMLKMMLRGMPRRNRINITHSHVCDTYCAISVYCTSTYALRQIRYTGLSQN